MADRRVRRRPPPVFVLGMTMRSGTNYLQSMLGLHPQLRKGGALRENFLLEHADSLDGYVRATARHWNPDWRVDERLGGTERLMAELGSGILSFMDRPKRSKARFRLVTKSPSVRGLEYFPSLFPDCQALILVRDGRAVTESTVRSFGRSYEMAMRDWNAAAQTVLRFAEQHRGREYRWRIVRYEDLYAEPERELRRILRWLDCDPESFPFDQAASLPIRGSSELVEDGDLHWEPVARTDTFQPTDRFAAWPARLHRRFNHVAGAAQRALGYQTTEVGTSLVAQATDGGLDLVYGPLWPAREAVRLRRSRR